MPIRNTARLPISLILAVSVLTSAVQAKEATRIAAKAVPTTGLEPLRDSDWRPVVTGHLKNGVRFAILPRRGNEPGVGLLMRNEGGFVAERRPGERGLAHLIEHVVFFSPTSNAPNDLHRLPRIGLPLTFPAPSAGTTSWRETNYFLSTKTTRTADLDTLLALFREVAGDLTFRPDAVDDARGQVMREMADKKLGNAIYASYIAAIAPGSPTDVIEAQNSDDVPAASIETIRALYHRLYEPENIMVVVVGNVDVAQTKALIRQRFGSWKSGERAHEWTPVPRFQSSRITPISFSSFQQGRRTAMITVVMPTPPPPATRTQQADTMLMDMLAVRAVNDRLARAQPDSPLGKTGIRVENGEQGHRLIMLWDNFAAGQWQAAVAGLGKATCNFSTAGFSDLEWAAAKQNVIRDLDQRSKAMAETPNVELAKDLSHALAAGQDMIPPDELLRRARALLPTITTRAGNGWWLRQWQRHTGTEHIRVEAPELAQITDPTLSIRTTVDGSVRDASCKMRR